MAAAEHPVQQTPPAAKPDTHRRNLAELDARHAIAEEGGGKERRARERKAGKLSARERIDFLLDEGTFEETDKFVTHRATDFGMAEQRVPGDGFITGYGRVHGRVVFVFAQDFTVFRRVALGGQRREDRQDHGHGDACGCAVVGLNDSGGARIQEGVVSLAAYTDIFPPQHAVQRSDPQISAIMGPCAGGAVYSPAITDFTVMTEKTQLHVRYRPRRHQDGDARRCNQSRARRCSHAQRDLRFAHFMAHDDQECLAHRP